MRVVVNSMLNTVSAFDRCKAWWRGGGDNVSLDNFAALNNSACPDKGAVALSMRVSRLLFVERERDCGERLHRVHGKWVRVCGAVEGKKTLTAFPFSKGAFVERRWRGKRIRVGLRM